MKSQGKLVEAADAYQTAVRINPKMAEAFSNLGIILESMGQIDDAITVYEKALQLEPNFADALSNYGIVLKHSGRYPEAILAFRKSLNLRPDTAAVWANLGAALVDIGEVEQASAALQRAIELNPNLVAAHCNLGACYRELNQVEAAKEAFKRAVQLDPASVMALSMLAGLYENLNDLESAHDLARKALEIDPLNVSSNLTVATCERRWKNWDQALARLESVDASLATDKVNAMVAKELGIIHDNLGDYSTAYDYYLEANRFQSTDWALRDIDGTEYLNKLIKLKERFSLDWVKSWTPSDQEQRPSPVFMLGFPRSGTTLLDQILNAHPDIETLEEKPILEKVELGLGTDYPDGLAELTISEIVEMRAQYFGVMDQHLDGARQLSKIYIDKLPLNTARVGLIHRLFPDARIIFSLRHPCDCGYIAVRLRFERVSDQRIQGHLGAIEHFRSTVCE